MSATYLDVPFREKDQAKALGARWDPAARKWYVPQGKDLAPFSAWLAAADASANNKVTSPVLPGSVQTAPVAGGLVVAGVESVALSATASRQSLSQLLAGVAHAVAQAFSTGVWITAEVVQVQMRNGHVYLELSERTPEGVVLASARGMIWSSTAQRILPVFEAATGGGLAPGMKLLIRARPVFKPQYGFSLEIDAIDPDYTLGELEARKREIRSRLMQEGIFAANKALPSPWDYTCVLVVAPQGAAGLGDFQAEANRLEQFALCRFIYVHSRFQGEGAAGEIRRALENGLEQHKAGLDAVVIIRGGGAAGDLAWLNDYELARTVCTLPYPVLTGIGHERDSTVLDEVANLRFDTPSKVIAGIEQVIRSRTQQAQASFEQIAALAGRTLKLARDTVESRLAAVRSGAGVQLAQAREITSDTFHALRLQAGRTVQNARQETRSLLTEVRHNATLTHSVAQREVPALFSEINAEAQSAITLARTLTQTRLQAVQDRARLDVRHGRALIDTCFGQVVQSSRQGVENARAVSTALFREIAGQGPEKTLGRGFAVVRSGDGRPVTSVGQVHEGNTLSIQLHDGRVAVHALKADPLPGKAES